MNNTIHKILLGASLVCSACSSRPDFDPNLYYVVTERKIQSLPTPFDPLNKEELQSLWGKELYLGVKFVQEADYYRAITAFKSSLFLLPKSAQKRKAQIEFYLALSYYFGGKYQEALQFCETGALAFAGPDFPAYKEFRIMLYDCYNKTEQFEKADAVLPSLDSETSAELTLSRALLNADFCIINDYAPKDPLVNSFLWDYTSEMKSIQKAKTLQAILPGAGYYYVGLKKAALTSFIINTLFLAAAYQFYDKGLYAASLVTLSLEAGWYFGGINGAGLAANEYNERLYENLGKELMIQKKAFPILMFNYAF